MKKDGHHIVFESVSPAPAIKYYDEFFYDNIILMAPAAKGKIIFPFDISVRFENSY